MSTPFEVCHEAILKLLDKKQKNRRRFKSAFPITWLIRKEATSRATRTVKNFKSVPSGT